MKVLLLIQAAQQSDSLFIWHNLLNSVSLLLAALAHQ